MLHTRFKAESPVLRVGSCHGTQPKVTGLSALPRKANLDKPAACRAPTDSVLSFCGATRLCSFDATPTGSSPRISSSVRYAPVPDPAPFVPFAGTVAAPPGAASSPVQSNSTCAPLLISYSSYSL